MIMDHRTNEKTWIIPTGAASPFMSEALLSAYEELSQLEV